MTGDPIQHFGEERLGLELAKWHQEMLLEDAQEFLREHPKTPVVGLMLDRAAMEYTELRAAFAQASGEPFGGRGFIGVAPRAFVLRILRANAPRAIEWLPDSVRGTTPMLPVVAFTEHGVRFAAIEIE